MMPDTLLGTESGFVGRIAPELRALLRTAEPVVTLPVPGPMAREMALAAAIEQRALVLVAGADGELLASTAESLGKEVLRLVVPPGRQVEQAHLLRFLQGPGVDTVVLAQVESSTGAAAPLAELADVLRLHPEIHCLVEATHSLGAMQLETDRWSLDTVLAPGDGSLGMPHGVSFVATSARMLTRARAEKVRGRQFDLVAHHSAALEGAMLAPLAESVARAVEVQLQRMVGQEGLTSRWERHARLAALVERWVLGRSDVALVAVPGRRAATLSCLVLPAGLDGVATTEAVAALGLCRVTLGRGEGGRAELQLHHVGELQLDGMAELLRVLGAELDRL